MAPSGLSGARILLPPTLSRARSARVEGAAMQKKDNFLLDAPCACEPANVRASQLRVDEAAIVCLCRVTCIALTFFVE